MLEAATTLGFERLPRSTEIAFDIPTLLTTLALVVLTGLLVGVLPVVMLRHTNLAQTMREEGRSGTASRGARLVRRGLVTSQVAFALMLLVGAGVLLASFERVLAVDPGFDGHHVLSGTISLPTSRYADRAARQATVDRVLERVRALPGVEAAGVTNSLPFAGNYSDSVILAEGYQMAPGESLISPSYVIAGEGYFEAMRIGLVEGRFFDARDRPGAPRAIIVDERLARTFWPGQSAVGRRMFQPTDMDNFSLAPTAETDYFQVVGVVEEVRLRGLVDSADVRRIGTYYLPYAQESTSTVSLAIRTTTEPTATASAVRQEVARIDPEVPFYNVRTMDARLSESLVDRRTPMLLAAAFATVALFLAAIGIYGVLAFQVRQRSKEIGIRMALGAGASSIFQMVLREGATIVGAGAALGLIGAFFLRGTLQTQLYGVGAMDPFVVAGVAGVLVAVAIVACALPARRAAHTDPVVALSE